MVTSRIRRVARACAAPASYGKASALALALAAASIAACQTAPVTGRTVYNALSVEEENAIGNSSLPQILEGQTLIESGPEYAQVRRVMERLVSVADDPGYEWDVVLIDDDATVNAFALPGGKMAVYTGILPVAGSDAGLAVVMGHEIGHVVAHHGGEAMTRAMGLNALLALLEDGDAQTIAAYASEYVVQRPFGRDAELESDHIGLIYMARAGYDPAEAPRFWTRMAGDDSSAPGMAERYLSTHPPNADRIAQLESLQPKALQEWQDSAYRNGS